MTLFASDEGEAIIIRGDATHLPLDDESVDLVITSPPYFSLRKYQDEGKPIEGQIGGEASPQAFLEALWAATEEMARVLRPKGSIFVNLGDKYAGSGGHNNSGIAKAGGPSGATRRQAPDRYNQSAEVGATTIKPKSLMGLPWRYALGCTDHLGLLLRQEIIWAKRNHLPESVKDRCVRSHEQWFHLVKRGDYYASLDEIRTPHQDSHTVDMTRACHPLGKTPNTVWDIATEPLQVPKHLPQHFAAFPTEWPRRLILGFSPRGICLECGEGRFPVTDVSEDYKRHRATYGDWRSDNGPGQGESIDKRELSGQRARAPMPPPADRRIVGYACACAPFTQHEGVRVGVEARLEAGAVDKYPTNDPQGLGVDVPSGVGPWREYHLDSWEPPPTRPAVVLDPFGGTGTVALVARALGRVGIHVDLSADYCRLAEWRIFESEYGARTLVKTKHPKADPKKVRVIDRDRKAQALADMCATGDVSSAEVMELTQDRWETLCALAGVDMPSLPVKLRVHEILLEREA